MDPTYADFEPLVGETFEVPHPESGEVFVSLTLSQASRIGLAHEGREEPFSLMFEGPKDFALGQGTFLLRHEKLGDQHIFIVPIGESKDVRRYQAIYN